MSNKRARSQTRFNHFQVVLNIPVGSDIDFKEIPDEEIESYFYQYNFVKQEELETVLLDLKIIAKGTIAVLTDFRGQLERGTSERRPHWQLYVCTSRQTVKTEVLKALSMALYSVQDHKSIQVQAIRDVEATIDYVTKEGRLNMPTDSPWSPGLIAMTSAKFRRELAEDPVQRDILTGMARKYQKYLLDIMKGKPNDRLIYWVMDFAGKTGKSKFTRTMEKASLAITASIDHPRPFAKEIILNAQDYYAKHGRDPETVIIDLSRQVPTEYLSGFYGVLESLKNGKLTSMFQQCSKYEWKHPPHVIIFANQPPLSTALSGDRMVLLEIMGEDYDFAIRHSKCSVQIVKRLKRNVSYRYITELATNQDIKQLTKAKYFIFTDEELAMHKIKHKDTELSHCSVSNYQGLSEIIYANDNTIPQNVLALVMAIDEINEKDRTRY